MALYFIGRYEGSIECYDKAIELNPNIVAPWWSKGVALYDMGRYGAARYCFKKAEDLDFPLASQVLERLEKEGH